MGLKTEDLTQIDPMHVTSRTGVNTLFLLQLKAEWKVSKIKDLVSLIIHLATAIVSFQHFRSFQKIGIHRSTRSVFQEVLHYLSENPEISKGQPLEYFAGLPWSQYLNSMAQTGHMVIA